MVLVGIGAFLLGAFTAERICVASYGSIMESGLAIRTGADITEHVSILEHLRAGRTAKAVALEEAYLDGDIVGAAGLEKDGLVLSAQAIGALARERKARSESGYRAADPSVQTMVDCVLQRLPAGE